MDSAPRPAAAGKPRGFRGAFRDDDDARAVYAEAAGIQRIWPLAIAVPEDAADLRLLVQWAHETRTPLIPRGSGSSMAGGAIGAGVIADVSRLRDVSPAGEGRHLLVGPGVLRAEADAAAGIRGLRFPVDPSSGAFCTIGGMASTNAAGAHTLKYGSMRPWVAALDCIFDDGTRAVIRRGEPAPAGVPAVSRFLDQVAPEIHATGAARLQHAGVRKDSSGYALAEYARSGDLVDLLVGSEGTLALFAGVELSLAERPGATASLLAAFSTLEAAVGATRVARNLGAAACELLDRTFLDFVRQATDTGGTTSRLPADTDAVLLIEIEAASGAAARDGATAWSHEMRAHGATHVDVAVGADAEAALWDIRHAASPVLSRLDPALKSMQFIEDGAVPPENLAAYVRGVRAAMRAHNIRGAIFGHAGDAHIHVNPLIDVGDPDWRAQLRALLGDVVTLTLQLGGTLSGEHGDGRLRAPLEPMMWPDPNAPAPRLFHAVKTAFDPLGILNPGAKVATAGAPIVGDVKYDPALPPLPAAARRALDRVEAERLYATPRLALLGAGD